MGADGGRGVNAYQYVLLRLVPRVDREEFINVGVVLYSQDAGFLDAAWELDERRAGALSPTCDLDGVRSMLERVRAVCRGETGRGLPTLDKPASASGGSSPRARPWCSRDRSTGASATTPPSSSNASSTGSSGPRTPDLPTPESVRSVPSAQGPHRDGARRGDVERVDAARHRDAQREVGLGDRPVRQAVALGADDEGKPLRRLPSRGRRATPSRRRAPSRRRSGRRRAAGPSPAATGRSGSTGPGRPCPWRRGSTGGRAGRRSAG